MYECKLNRIKVAATMVLLIHLAPQLVPSNAASNLVLRFYACSGNQKLLHSDNQLFLCCYGKLCTSPTLFTK